MLKQIRYLIRGLNFSDHHIRSCCYKKGSLENNKFYFSVANKLVNIENEGEVIHFEDSLAKVSGLRNSKTGELIQFSGGVKGLVIDLYEEYVSVLVLSNQNIQVGSIVNRSNEQFSMPIGYELSGRILNALGNPIDNLETTKTNQNQIIPIYTFQYKNQVDKMIVKDCTYPEQFRNVCIFTGIKFFDSFFNIRPGYCYIFNSQEKKNISTICQDMVVNNKSMFEHSDPSKQLYYVYVFVGQKQTVMDKFIFRLKQYDCIKYTTFVCSSDQDSYSLQYLSIFTGQSVAEYMKSQGRRVLIIYDDYSKHFESFSKLLAGLKRPTSNQFLLHAAQSLYSIIAKRQNIEQFQQFPITQIVMTCGDKKNFLFQMFSNFGNCYHFENSLQNLIIQDVLFDISIQDPSHISPYYYDGVFFYAKWKLIYFYKYKSLYDDFYLNEDINYIKNRFEQLDKMNQKYKTYKHKVNIILTEWYRQRAQNKMLLKTDLTFKRKFYESQCNYDYFVTRKLLFEYFKQDDHQCISIVEQYFLQKILYYLISNKILIDNYSKLQNEILQYLRLNKPDLLQQVLQQYLQDHNFFSRNINETWKIDPQDQIKIIAQYFQDKLKEEEEQQQQQQQKQQQLEAQQQ